MDWLHRIRSCIVALAAIVTILSAPPIEASSNSSANLAIHLTSPISKSPCGAAIALPDCGGIVTSGRLESCFAFVVLTNGSPQSGVQGVQFGVTYDGSPGAGVDVFGWSACAAGQITTGGWPAPGAGINLIWNSCHVEEPHGTGHGVAVVAGYFYLSAYSPDRLELTNAESQHGLPITDCNQVQTSGFDSAPPRRGHAVFSPAGDQSGWNPCTPTPLTTGSCHVDGPRLIPPGSVGAVYTITDPIPGVEYHWFTSSGTLRITGPSVGNSITVDAPEIGGEQLIVSSMATSPIISGHITVTVFGLVPVVRTSWSAIKRFGEAAMGPPPRS